MLKKSHLAASALLLALGSFLAPAQAENAPAVNGDTVKKIKARGELVCGVHPARHGFAAINSKGQWEGLDVDFCRALATAVQN